MDKEGKEHLRNELMQELWRMNKMDIIVHLMEIIEGETAALGYLASATESSSILPGSAKN